MDWYGRESVFVCRREIGRIASFFFGLSAWVDTSFCVQEDSRHEIWIGSSTGLYCYKEGAPTAWKHYTMKDGLPNDFIYSILKMNGAVYG